MSSLTARRDYRVADLSLAPFGRKEIHLAEHEMPGLRALRKEFGPLKPLKGLELAEAGGALMAAVGSFLCVCKE